MRGRHETMVAVRQAHAGIRAPYMGDFANDSPSDELWVSGTCEARYVGRWPGPIRQAGLWIRISLPAAVAGAGGDSLNWSEIALGTGAQSGATSNLTLTPQAFANINADVVGGVRATFRYVVDCNIPPDTDLWVMVAAAYETTMPTFMRALGTANRGFERLATLRPSTAIGVPTAFTGSVTASRNILTSRMDVVA